MKPSVLIFFLSVKLLGVFVNPGVNGENRRRRLHQPLDPEGLASPPGTANLDQATPVPAPSNVTLPTLPSTAQQPFPPIKTLAIVCSVAIVTLGMLSALAFFLYRQRNKYRSKSRMLAEKERSLSFRHDSGIPRSSFLNIGTMERRQCPVVEPKGANGDNSPPRRRLDSVKKLESHLPSPELQPLPPLSRYQIQKTTSHETSLSDEESRETIFHTPEWSAAVCYDDASNSTVSLRSKKVENFSEFPVKTEVHYNSPVVQAKGTPLAPPLSYLEDTLIKQDQQRPAASPPPPPPTPS